MSLFVFKMHLTSLKLHYRRLLWPRSSGCCRFFWGCLAVFWRFFFLTFCQSLWPASSEDSSGAETLGRTTFRTWPKSLKNPEQPLDPSRESLREYIKMGLTSSKKFQTWGEETFSKEGFFDSWEKPVSGWTEESQSDPFLSPLTTHCSLKC